MAKLCKNGEQGLLVFRIQVRDGFLEAVKLYVAEELFGHGKRICFSRQQAYIGFCQFFERDGRGEGLWEQQGWSQRVVRVHPFLSLRGFQKEEGLWGLLKEGCW